MSEGVHGGNMATKKAMKSYKIFSDNPKMDMSGLAGKPKQYKPIEWKEPKMNIDDIMEVEEHKNRKSPEMDD
jgi:hypothetical protein